MPFAYWMILAAALLPYLTILLVKRAGRERFDNSRPRAWLDARSGWQQRGDWAHRNHFETFPIFAAAVFVAELTHASQAAIDWLAGLYVVLRVLYTLLYLADKPTPRSAVWALGFLVTLALFLLGA
jgi:uncharacterized MAPEG superfamily protein